MKVGTDGVLLGSWANIDNAQRILDIGTGTGIIALMCAQRSNAIIDAVEIEKNAFDEALLNINNSKWKSRISVFHNSLQEYAGLTNHAYDLIISNPPFFKNSLKPGIKARSLARHNDELTYESFFHFASQLLNSQGRIAVIIPAEESENIINISYFNGLFPLKQTKVRPYDGKEYSRCLIEFSGNKNTCSFNELTIKEKDSNAYTNEYCSLTKDFYLNM